MKIGELAKLSSFTVETIRYYEKKNLIPSTKRNINNNYREYNEEHLNALLFISRCRALDMTLSEIQQIITAKTNHHDSCSAINTIIQEHLQHVKKRIKELKILEKELITLNQQCPSANLTSQCGILKNLKNNTVIGSNKIWSDCHISGTHHFSHHD